MCLKAGYETFLGQCHSSGKRASMQKDWGLFPHLMDLRCVCRCMTGAKENICPNLERKKEAGEVVLGMRSTSSSVSVYIVLTRIELAHQGFCVKRALRWTIEMMPQGGWTLLFPHAYQNGNGDR